MPEEKVDEKPKYEPGKKYIVKARNSVQLLSVGTILHPPDTYTGVLDKTQLEEIVKHVNIGVLTLEVVEESEQETTVKKEVPKEVPKKEEPEKVEPVKKEEPKKAWTKTEVSETKVDTEVTKTPLEKVEEKSSVEVDEGVGGKEEKEPAPEKDKEEDKTD